MKILFVEDEQVLLDLYVLEFSTNFPHAQCFQARDGIEALECMKENEISLIITDGKMPKMNGIDLARTVRQMDNKIPLILVTGYIYEYDQVVHEGIFSKIFDKPIDFDDFLAQMAEFLPVQPLS